MGYYNRFYQRNRKLKIKKVVDDMRRMGGSMGKRIVRRTVVRGAVRGATGGRSRRRGGALLPILIILIILSFASGGVGLFTNIDGSGIMQWLPIIGIGLIVVLLVRRGKRGGGVEQNNSDTRN